MGFSGSSSEVTLYEGLPSGPSNISLVYSHLIPFLNIEGWVLILLNPTGNRLCSEWYAGSILISPVANN